MKRSTVLATGAAIAAGPSGVKRLLGVAVVVALVVGLGLVALVWLGSRSGGDRSEGLSCAPATVAVAYSPADTPPEVRSVVENALRDAGREPVLGGYGRDQSRDLAVTWWPSSSMPDGASLSGRTLRLETVPTTEEITGALEPLLPPCRAEPPSSEAAEEPSEPADGVGTTSEQPSQEWSPLGMLVVAVLLWWTAGPHLVRWTWRSLWPIRVACRRLQRRSYRRAVARGHLTPAEWPQRIPEGQWWESNKHLHDRRPCRAQIADGEAERLAELEALREEGRVITPRRWGEVLRDLIHRPASTSPDEEHEKREVRDEQSDPHHDPGDASSP